MMTDTKDYNAIVTIDINAPTAEVWDTITKPELIKKYMHGTNTTTDWQVGSPVSWRGEWQGKAYEDKGKVLANDPQKRLQYTHWSPLGGTPDEPENYHTVTLELEAKGDITTLTLTQSNNPSQEAADKMADTSWKPMIEQLKKVAEK